MKLLNFSENLSVCAHGAILVELVYLLLFMVPLWLLFCIYSGDRVASNNFKHLCKSSANGIPEIVYVCSSTD